MSSSDRTAETHAGASICGRRGTGADVVVTGIGVVTALGAGVDTVWPRLLAGEDGTRELSRFPADAYRVRRACEVAYPGPHTGSSLMLDITLQAGHEAAAGAGLLPLAEPDRVGIAFGTLGSADLRRYEQRVRSGGSERIDRATATALLPSEVAGATAAALGCEGRVATVLAACASGNHAIALGRQWIRTGRADVVFAGGADVVSQTQYTHFHNLRALSPDVCRPFDRRRRGLVIGEGAAFLVLEDARHARRRGAQILARVLGVGASSDAYHMTAPEPTGEGARRALHAALADAGVSVESVDYVSAHGTGTLLNDRMEGLLIRELFGPRVPTSSVKSMIGHCMGAASAIEAVVCVLALRDQAVPPTTHFEEPDTECPIDCVPNVARQLAVRVAVNNAFAFGGNNCIVILGANA
jgi:3-oxoacyl-[acyl-carrier-protein] synthase II